MWNGFSILSFPKNKKYLDKLHLGLRPIMIKCRGQLGMNIAEGLKRIANI
jgi:hypothetical protein